MPHTPRQCELARNALGLRDGIKKSYRNRFLAGPADVDEWRKMVVAGDAIEGTHTDIGVWFYLKRSGAETVLRKGEELDAEDFTS